MLVDIVPIKNSKQVNSQVEGRSRSKLEHPEQRLQKVNQSKIQNQSNKGRRSNKTENIKK